MKKGLFVFVDVFLRILFAIPCQIDSQSSVIRPDAQMIGV